LRLLRQLGRCVHDAKKNRRYQSRDAGRCQGEFSPGVQIFANLVSHDSSHSLSEILAGNAGGKGQRQPDIELATLEQAFGLDGRFSTESEHFFVACKLLFLDESEPDPPDERMKPEQSFHNHVRCYREVVATPNMAKLMGQNCL